jgi:hypothetical protein
MKYNSFTQWRNLREREKTNVKFYIVFKFFAYMILRVVELNKDLFLFTFIHKKRIQFLRYNKAPYVNHAPNRRKRMPFSCVKLKVISKSPVRKKV